MFDKLRKRNYLYLASYAHISSMIVTKSNANGKQTVKLKIHQYSPQSHESVRKYARLIVPKVCAIIAGTKQHFNLLIASLHK